MKTLKESILRSVQAGKYTIIEEWCKKYLQDPFTINSKNEVCMSYHRLTLDFEDYNELPEYIQFADDDRLEISLLDRESSGKVTSLRGLPKICKNLYFYLEKEIPALEIKVINEVELRKEPKITGDIYLKTPFISLYNGDKIDFKKIHIEGLESINVKYSSFYSRLFKKCIKPFIKDAILNSAPRGRFDYFVRIEYKHPLPNDPKSGIEKAFGDLGDLKKLEAIYYSEKRSLINYNGDWYLTI